MADDTMPRRERVADYPRPPRLEAVARPIRIVLGGETIAACDAAWRVLETFHPPTYYLPRAAFLDRVLRPGPRRSVCEWKGAARYWDLAAGGRVEIAAAWDYPEPTPAFAGLLDHLAVYPARMDGCWLDGELVRPQPGGFYGGWITAELVGPFKGGPGTAGW